MKTTARRIDPASLLEALPEAIVLTLLAALPAFLNVASERIFEEEKALLLRAAAVLVLPGVLLAGSGALARLLRRPIVLTFFAFTLMLLVAAIAGVAPRDAFMGAYLRRHGMLTWLALAVLFVEMCLVARSSAGRERLLGAIVVGSLWPSIYAAVQVFGVDPMDWMGHLDLRRSIGTFGSPVLLSGYLAVVIPLTALYLGRSNLFRVALLVQFAALASSASRGALVAVAAAAVTYVIVAGWARIPKRGLVAVVVALGTVAGAGLAARSHGDRLFDLTSGSSRVHLLIADGAVRLMAASGGRLWIGYGPESLRRVFPPYYSAEIGRLEQNDALPDRAHNETLDTLVSAGVIGAVLQLAFLALTVIGALRVTDLRMRAGLTAAAVAHLVEIQFGITGVVTRLTFFCLAAIVTGTGDPEPVAAAPVLAAKRTGKRGHAPVVSERPVAPYAVPWRWLSLAALAGALSLWLSSLTMGAAARSGTERDLIDYLADVSLATPLLYVALLAVALLLSWAIVTAAPRAATFVWVRSAALVVGIAAAVPLSITASRADVFSKAATGFEERGQWAEAVIAYREASRMQPAENYYLTGLGRALTQQARAAKPPDRAILRSAHEPFERAYARNPADPDHARHLASLLRIEAQTLDEPARAERLAAADRLYQQVTQLAPAIPGLWIEWASVDVERHQLPAALEKLARAMALNDTRADLWLLRGDVHARQRNHAEALADYDHVLSRDGRNLAALRGRTVALAELQRFDEADAAVHAALAIAPSDAESLRLRELLARRPGQGT